MNLLASRRGRRILFTALYLSEGAPIGFIWWALPTRLRMAGVDVGAITTLTSFLVLPWIFKFLWAPLIDGIRTRRWTLRSWILLMQFLMGGSLIPLLFWDLAVNLELFVPLLLLHAFAAATQDASIDALAIASVPNRERGSVNGWMQAGMLVGRSALGGGALLLEQRIGTTAVIISLVAIIWSSSALVLFSREPARHASDTERVRDRLRGMLLRLEVAFKSRTTWFGLFFAAIAGAGFEAVGAVAGPFMIDRGLSSDYIGRLFALNSVIAMAAGALVGGFVADRYGKRSAVSVFLILVFVCTVGFAALDLLAAGQAAQWVAPGMTLLYFCIGLFTSSSYALFMEITDPALGATQFSAFMGATNGCESWSAFSVGKAIPVIGYPAAFSLMGIVSLAALPLIRGLVRPDASTRRRTKSI